MRVLVVDDFIDSADGLAALLRLRGHEVAVAYDGLTALATANASFDVAILDLGMAHIDGFQVARTLRKRLGEALVLLAYTGYADEKTRQKALANGFDKVLVKPTLIDVIEGAFHH
jgi:CheY-like chemotaxis protein